MSESVFRPLTTSEKIFHDIVFIPAIKAGEKYLEAALPFLSLPIIKNVFEGLIEKVSEWVYAQMVEFVDITAIKLVNEAHQSAYDSASIRLKIVAHDKGVNSIEYIEARDKALDAMSQFTQFHH